jgi:periplasmic divalent cation tolerance protein
VSGEHLVVSTTLASEREASRLAELLVAARLAACAQVTGPVASTYRWQGAVESSVEWCLSLKTTRERYPALEAAVKEQHPYELPEIVAVSLEAGSEEYLAWITAELAE